MGADVRAPAGGFVDRGLDLVDAELQALQRIELRGDTAGHHDLDVVGTLAQLVADGLDHVRHAVGDARSPGEAGTTGAEHAGLGAQAEVAVAAGLAERLAGDEQPRALEQSLLDRGLDARSRRRRCRAAW